MFTPRKRILTAHIVPRADRADDKHAGIPGLQLCDHY